MRTLVTGGGGFIGSHVVDRLKAAGHDVSVVDLRPPHRPDVGHIPADINDLDALVEAFAGAEVVFHLAAYADVNDVTRDPVDATDANVVGVAKVWEACRRNNVGRAVLASTVWVYNGAVDHGGDGPLDEDAAFRLDDLGHLYTSSKVAAEMVAHSYKTLYDQEFTILRYGIPYGPRMRDSLVIPKFVGMALRSEPLTIQGDGSQYRNYVYVEDLAEAHVLALRPEAANQTFNLEGREKISIRSMVESIGETLGRPVDVTYTPARTGDYGGREISAAKAERVLGWRADVPFADGLRRYVDWHLARDAAPAPAARGVARPVPGRAPVAGIVAGLGLAVLALPALSSAGHSDPAARIAAAAGSLVAAAAAWGARRRGLSPVPILVASAVTVASVWLLSQASPGPVTLLLGLLVGFSVGASLAGQPLAGPPTAAGLAGTAALAATAVFGPSDLYWLAAALGVAGGIGPRAVAFARSGRAVPVARRVMRRRVSWALSAVVVLTTGLTASWVGATSASADWFGSVISHGSRAVPQVTVTFDGVPDADTARQVLQALDAEGVQATFFAAGREVEARPDVVRALVDHDQLVANNAYAPGSADFLDPNYGELGRAQQVFGRELGVCPTYFRPPAGRHTPLMARVVRRYGMSMVTWDVRVADRRSDDPRKLARLALDRIRAGSIVVFPLDGNGRFARPSLEATLPLVLRGLKGLDLESVRLDRMLGADPYAGRCTRSA